MAATKKKYNLPDGYSLLRTGIKSKEFLANPVKFISKSMEAFGGTYTASLGLSKKLILTQHPDFINYILKDNHKNYSKSELSTESAVEFFGSGLLFSNGDYWLRQRRLIQPAFHREKIQGLYDIMIRSIDDFLEDFPAGAQDIYPLMHKVSFNILIRSLFDIKITEGLINEMSSIFTELQDFLIRDINQPFRKFFYPFTGAKKAQLRKAKRLREIFVSIIEERQAEGKGHADLLDLLLGSRYEDTGEPMSAVQITDELMIIVFAGHETTANTLSWLLYLLSVNDESREKLAASVKEGTPYESLSNEYLKAAISESMRLYPAAWMTERVALEDDSFGEYSFPKGTIIIPFFFGMHRDKALWEDEEKFDPERFLADGKLIKSKGYLPFGTGPRMCIGNNFAMAEMQFFVAAFLKKFSIKATGQVPEMKPLITLRPEKVILHIERVSP